MKLAAAQPRVHDCLLALLALAGALAVGCGGSGSGKSADRRDAATAYTQLVRAFSDRDGAAACKLLTEDARQGLAATGGVGSCERAVERGPRLAHAYRDAAGKLGADDVKLAKDRALVRTGTSVAGPAGRPGRGGAGGRPGRGGAGGRPGRGGAPGKPGKPGKPGRPGEPGAPVVGIGEPGAPGAPGPNGGGGGGGGGIDAGRGGGGGGGAGGAPGAGAASGGVGALALLRKVGDHWKVAYAPFLRFAASR